MERNQAKLSKEVTQRLEEGFRLWDESRIPVLEPEARYQIARLALQCYQGAHCMDFAVACECFALFRFLHKEVEHAPIAATLLGDYFFSQFSKALIPLDSIPLNDAFAAYLEQDVAGNAVEFKQFIQGLPAVMRC